jgi:hypothetical protein
MKKQLTTLILAAFLITLWSGCSSKITISSEYDKSTDFTPYKTYSFYGWAKESDKIINDIDKKNLEDAVANELAKRGISYLESGGDLTVSLFIQFDRQRGVNAYTDYYGRGPYGYGYGPGWGWGYGYTTTRYQEYDYVVGTLVIDIFDHQQKKLIWQGVGTKTVDEKPNNREYGINKAVRGIMSKYPIKPSNQKK